MYEMLEIVKYLLLLAGLLYFAWKDYHTYSVKVIPTIIFGIIGIGVNFLIEGNRILGLEILGSMAIGIGLIIISIVSKESIGIGDGILFLMTGCYLNFFENIILLLRTIFFVGGFTILCFATKKIQKEDRIPMAPFMLAAYVTTLSA